MTSVVPLPGVLTYVDPPAGGADRRWKYPACAASAMWELAKELACAGELLRLCREWLCVLFCRLRPEALGRIGAGAVMLTTEVEPAVAAMLRVLALEPLLVCRRSRPLVWEGIENPDPESRCCLPSGTMGIVDEDSRPEAEALAEVEEVLDATDTFCAWRRRSSSRVRRFTYRYMVSYPFTTAPAYLGARTTASCSFSSC